MEKETLDQVQSLWMGGDGAVAIVKKLGLCCHSITINRLAKKNGWGRVSNQRKITNSVLEKTDEIIMLFDNGIQASEIARKLDLRYCNVIRFLLRNNRNPELLHYSFNQRADIKKKRSVDGKKLWKEGKVNVVRMWTPQARQKAVEKGIARWRDDQYMQKMRIIAREKWYKYRMWEKMKKFKETKPENMVAEILSLLGVKFSRNYSIGKGFSVDFYCPDHKIMLDVDGEYWHGRFVYQHKQVAYVKQKDQRKNSYVKEHMSEQYIRLWEQYTLSREALVSILSRVFKRSVTIIDFSFKDLSFREINSQETRNFVEKYHYAMRLGPFIKGVGVFLQQNMIAVCAFKYPTYATNHGCLELSRFCIHPSYQIKNLASFCLSRVLRIIDANEIITYADTTQGHDGTIYRAANFKEIGRTSQSYYYVDEYNAKYHKKVIYNHAIRMKMTEAEYVEKTNLKRITEQPKIKFLYQHS